MKSAQRIAAIGTAVALIAAAFLFAHLSQNQLHASRSNNPLDRVSTPSETNAKPAAGGLPSKQGLPFRPLSHTIATQMTPDRAYADAYAILKCSHAANSVLDAPEDITEAQRTQFAESRVAGLDCLALDSGYSAYDLAKFAAENGNLQAQLDFSAIAATVFNEEKNALDPNPVAQYKADSLKFLNMAASAGHPDAFARLAENYRTGLFSDKNNFGPTPTPMQTHSSLDRACPRNGPISSHVA